MMTVHGLDRSQRRGRRRGLRGGALFVGLGVLAALLVAPAQVSATTYIAAPKVSPLQPMVSERTSFVGLLGVTGTRKVALQYRTATSWATLTTATTSSGGRYSFTIRPTKTRTYRVVASSVSRVSKARKVAIAQQSVSLTMPVVLAVGVPKKVVSTARPIRAGRLMKLQTYVNGAWVTKAQAKQTTQGTAAFRYAPTTTGKAKWRVLADSFNGAWAKSSVSLTRRSVPEIELISRGAGGQPLSGQSYSLRISTDGRYVAYASEADGIIPGDVGGDTDVFLHDRITGITRAVTKGGGTSFAESMSADGRFLTIVSDDPGLVDGDDNGEFDVFLWDRVLGTFTVLSRTDADQTPGNARSANANVSANGAFVVFLSRATDLLATEAPVDGEPHLYRYTVATGELIGIDRKDGAWGNGQTRDGRISDDGSVIAFRTSSTNLVSDIDTEALVTWTAGDTPVFTNHTPNLGATAVRITITADGRFVVFDTDGVLDPADQDVKSDVYRLDRLADSMTLLSYANGTNDIGARVSPSGKWVVFETFQNLPGDDAPGDVDVVRINLATGQQTLITTGGTGYEGAIAADGLTVGFSSEDPGFAADDGNGLLDVFLRTYA